MDEVRVTRLRPPDRLPGRAIVIAAILITVAVAKPWGSPPVAVPPADRAAVGPAGGPPTTEDVVRGSDDPIAEHCFEPSGWRVFSHERWARSTIRSWKSVVPASTARGPLDPAIPAVLVATSRVPGLGYCAPVRGVERPPPGARLTVWRIESDGAVWKVPARRLLPVRPTILGGLYAPSGRGGGSWAAGRFVFAVRTAGYERWWAVEVVIDATD
jgi:hypothetical protein